MTLTDHPPTAQPRATYRAVLASPHVVRLLVGTLIGRLPNGMAPVAIVLSITSTGGSLAFAGLLSALYSLASALSQPVKGRLMDRYGQTRVSGTAVILNSSSLLLLAEAATAGHAAFATAVVAVAGLCTPPLEAGLRALWPAVLRDPGQRRIALSLDTGTQGLLYIVGPLVVTALSAAHGPGLALVATAVLGLLGTVIVLTAAPSRVWRPAADPGREKDGRLLSPALLMLYVALAGTGCAIGAMNVWSVAMAASHRLELLSGALPAAFSTGSFLGGLLYGRRVWPGSMLAQLRVGAACFLTGWLPLLALPGPPTAIAAVAVPGLFLTVVISCAFLTVDSLAPPSRATEACAWLILSVGVGQAAGTALGGALSTRPLASAALPAAAAAASLTALACARLRLTPAGVAARSPGRHRRPRARPAHR
ncbi:MFS transporter [Streptomyces sp. NPDC048340]|uniref:MFS transporter n=1 Tax=Streptomyces sp. NPDC048340 TaxID=3365537 RepID=UPI003719BAFE